MAELDCAPGEFLHEALHITETLTKGRYVTTKAPIEIGTVVLQTYGWMYPKQNLATDRALAFIRAAPAASPIEHSVLFRRLHSLCPRVEAHGQLSDEALVAKLNENSFDHGLYPYASFFNHSCKPNCCTQTDEDKPGSVVKLVVRLVASVSAGEELCISYLDAGQLLLPQDQRQAHLQASYGFTCACARCTLPLHSPSRAEELIRSPSPCCQSWQLPGNVGYICVGCQSETPSPSIDGALMAGFASLQHLSALDRQQRIAQYETTMASLSALAPSHWIKTMLARLVLQAIEAVPGKCCVSFNSLHHDTFDAYMHTLQRHSEWVAPLTSSGLYNDRVSPCYFRGSTIMVVLHSVAVRQRGLKLHSLRYKATKLQADALDALLFAHDYWVIKQMELLADCMQACKTLQNEQEDELNEQSDNKFADVNLLAEVQKTALQRRSELNWLE
eukprot:TRINITY_DN117_c0_g1_i2.p1 TRINITY_DN117_c0_g1~~TRINITY_DN117_c0_g1_i2.p1  ORF type:complete len:445 (+),score=51.62 TRINITY_DN117_c0_g1_i2:2-1336(+)